MQSNNDYQAVNASIVGDLRRSKRRSNAVTEVQSDYTFPISQSTVQEECETCGKVFKSHQGLTRHETIHSDDRTYECRTCNKTFKRQDTLRVHEQSHEAHHIQCKEKQCKKVFRSILAYKRHKRSHTGARCDVCSAVFSSEETLKDHRMKQHSLDMKGVEDIKIGPQCNSCLKHPHQLVEHAFQTFHQCMICRKLLLKCRVFAQHCRTTHNVTDVCPEKGYQCEKCFKLFGSERTLTNHVNSTSKMCSLNYRPHSSLWGYREWKNTYKSS